MHLLGASVSSNAIELSATNGYLVGYSIVKNIAMLIVYCLTYQTQKCVCRVNVGSL